MSETGIKIELHGIGIGKALGLLKPHLAPITVGRLLRTLQDAPISGPVMRYGTGQICLSTTVVAGKEKAVNQVEAGDLAYTPQTSSICIFSESLKPYSPVNKIGLITEGLKLFDRLRTGITLSLQLCE